MDYQFENLGPDRFQQLVQALITRSYPDAGCFPIGQADGGRDAALRSRTHYYVFQVKYTASARSVPDPVTWILSAVRSEAKRIARLDRPRRFSLPHHHEHFGIGCTGRRAT